MVATDTQVPGFVCSPLEEGLEGRRFRTSCCLTAFHNISFITPMLIPLSVTPSRGFLTLFGGFVTYVLCSRVCCVAFSYRKRRLTRHDARPTATKTRRVVRVAV